MLSFRNSIFTALIMFGLLAGASLPVFADDKTDAAPESTAAPAGEAVAAPSDPAQEQAAEETKTDDKQEAGADIKDSPEDIAAAAEMAKALVHGPAKVQLGEQATLDMPKDFIFLPKEQALQVMQRMGNHMDEENFYGLIVPADENKKWFVAASFDDSGFIKDDDQGGIDADKILADMQKAVKDDNADRAARGVAQLEIVGWIEKPHYDSKAHQLIWSVEAREIAGANEPANPDNSVNYNTFALGRGGFISLNLVTARSTVDSDRQAITALLKNLTFNDGKRYENFDPKTDKIAEYGLMALIGGIAVKKLGLFAVIAAVAVKSAKVLVVAAIAGAAAVKKFFKRRDPTV